MPLPDLSRPGAEIPAGAEKKPLPYGLGEEARLYPIMGLCALASFWLVKEATKHMFVEGMTDKERNGILVVGGGVAAIWAAKTFFDIDEKYYSTEALLAHASERAQEYVQGKAK